MSKTVEKLDEVAPEAIDSLRELATRGVEFIETNAPEACHEIILRGLAVHYLAAAAWAVAAVVGVILSRSARNWFRAAQERPRDILDMGEEKFFAGGARLLSLALVAIAFANATANIIAVIRIHIAPRLYIMEYLADLVK
jgi:hypothetical protein